MVLLLSRLRGLIANEAVRLKELLAVEAVRSRNPESLCLASFMLEVRSGLSAIVVDLFVSAVL
jgi:hypothetical protein